jgi:hypothetical protein
MPLIHLIITAVAAIAALYYCYLFYTSYREIAAQPGDWKPWERLWAAGSGSATKLWTRVVGLVASAMAVLVGFAPMLGPPGVADFIKTNFQPQTVTIIMIAIMAVTELARNRSA